jgi:hypothetical protein
METLPQRCPYFTGYTVCKTIYYRLYNYPNSIYGSALENLTGSTKFCVVVIVKVLSNVVFYTTLVSEICSFYGKNDDMSMRSQWILLDSVDYEI